MGLASGIVPLFVLMTACAQTPQSKRQSKLMSREILSLPAPEADMRLRYGDDTLQFGDLRVPSGPGPHPVAIVIHGGFWRAAYSVDHIGHLAAALTKAGVATWAIEYRRIGNPGGGWPGTLDDVALGADHLKALATQHNLDLRHVVAIGHSAGGQLALWLGGRSGDAIPLRGVVSLAGVADLRRGYELGLGGGVVRELLGGSPEEVADRYKAASPIERLPLAVPQRLIHGTEDDIVPIEISERYVKAAGAQARLIKLEGADHFAPIDPRSKEWRVVEETVLSLLR
jgi:acetyl esterase/lipase